VARDAGARAAGVRAPELRDAAALEELPAARGVAEAHAAARAELDRGVRDARQQLVERRRRGRRREHGLAVAELGHERGGAHAGVDALDRRDRRRLARDRRAQQRLDVVAHDPDLAEAHLAGRGQRHPAALELGPQDEVVRDLQQVALLVAVAARGVREVDGERLAEPVPQRCFAAARGGCH
jgi:hypothetical protein